ncbi:hypothetical protein [Bernardetia sp. MNP-M8]|uniref:hypothetical protein n=1 Tax=Bernardetia sp. MNP-M8 TaxID=3127470 RepID=UPI0030CDAD2B
MEALEFKGKIEKGIIRLPSEYKDYDQEQVQVIVLIKKSVENENSINKKEKLRLAFQKMTDINMFSKIDNPVTWQKKLRNEWE